MDVAPVAVTLGERSSAVHPNGAELSRSQYLMWLGQELEPDVPLYNMVLTFRIAGPIDAQAFGQAWQSVVDASDSLRTTVTTVDGVPQRRVADQMPVEMEIVDLRSTPDPELAADRWAHDRKTNLLPLDTRLWDAALLLIADDVVVWYMSQHHLISDAHSFSVVLEQMSERYNLAVAGDLASAQDPPQYSAYVKYAASAQETIRWAKSEAYWAEKAQRTVEPTQFYGRTISGTSNRVDRLAIDLGPERSARIRAIATTPEFASISSDLSQYTIWSTLLFAFLKRIGAGSTLRVGSPFFGRPTPEFRSTIGLFVEVGALDATISDDDTFATLAKRVQREIFDGIRNARPGTATADLNRSFDVLMNFVTARLSTFAGFDVENQWLHTGYGDRDHALRVQITDFEASGNIRLHLDVNVELFGDDERIWLLEQFDRVIDHFLQDPTRALGSFDLLTDDQRRDRVTAFNDTDNPYPRTSSVIDLFSQHVTATPTAVALVEAGQQLTYAALDTKVNQLARELRRHGVDDGARVAVLVPRSIDAVVSILGVLAAGGAWVPIDGTYPAARQQWMIDDADPVVIISNGDGTPEGERHVIDIGSVPDDGEVGPPPVNHSPDGLAYMIYTSGSTGTPKGTMLTHGGLVNYLTWAREHYLDGEVLDFALYSSLSFDLTITSLFVPLVTGGRVVVYGASAEQQGLEILDVFADDAVDVVKLTPAHLALIREQGAAPERIRRLIIGGENFRTELANEISELFDHDVVIFNEYGPTEAVVGCMIHRFDPSRDTEASVPIGLPAANAEIHVVDRYGQPVPSGVTGEMVIVSDGVALGYWNRPELTAERFSAADPRTGRRSYRTGDLARWGAGGRLEFLGRNDDQVKIRGARIELGEIETALLSHPSVESGVVDVVAFADFFSGAVEYCATCGLPSNQPDSDFDADNVCADCRAYAELSGEVARYFRTPQQLRTELSGRQERASGQPYDSMVLVSGGKDSTYMLYQLVREYGVRPLVFLLDNGFISDSATDNVRAACEDLGIDMHIASTPHMNDIFVDSLKRHANVCDGCYKTIYTLSLELARAHGISTIITGLARGQLFETRLADTFKAREFDPETIDAWVLEARKAYHRIEDTVTERLAGDLFEGDRIFDEVDFIDFYRYVDVGLDEVYEYLTTKTVWTRPPDTGRSTNCLINDVGIHFHTTTRGHHNYAVPYSWDVRLGHKHREEAMDELDDDIDLDRVQHILEEIGFDEPLIDIRSEKRLAAYFVANSDVSTVELRSHLQSVLPDYMVPSYLMPLDELPLTVNGKIDRAALPDPGSTRPELDTEYVAPATDREHLLSEIWTSVFRLDDIGVHDNFFELGGDSIMCIQIVAEARRRDLALSARDIFTGHTISRIASMLDTSVATPAAHDVLRPLDEDLIARVTSGMSDHGGWDNVEDVFELTPTQLGMLFHCIRSPESEVYFGQGVSRLSDDIDVDLFRRMWEEVCARHASLRSRMMWVGLDDPVQVIQRDVALTWAEHDWRGTSGDDCRDDLDALLAGYRKTGLDPAANSLMSFAVVLTDDAAHFVWNSHHIMLDGWGAHLVYLEVLRNYEAAVRGDGTPPSPVGEPFRTYVERLAGSDPEATSAWWSGTLAGIDAATPIPIMSGSPAGGGAHHTCRIAVGVELSQRLDTFVRNQHITIGTLATSAWGLVLAHYSGQDDVVIGTTISGREDGSPGVEHMVGMLLATVPLRIRLDTEPVGDWLRRCQLESLAAREHASIGVADIQRGTAVPAGQPMFDSIVVIENYPTSDRPDDSSVELSPLEISSPSNFPLALLVYPGNELVIEAVYDSTLFDEDDVERLTGHLKQALDELTIDSERPIRELAIVPLAEQAELNRWAQGAEAPPPDLLVHELIDAVGSTTPEAIAVTGAERSLTYGDLRERSNQLAHDLRSRGIGRGDSVGVEIGTNPLLVGAVLAIFKAGATYVPLDPDLPVGRLRHMVDETALSAVMACGAPTLPVGATPDTVHRLDVDSPDIDQMPSDDLHLDPQGDDVAYVIYTSGSTGTPKGVMITHDNLAHSTAARPAHYGTPVGTFLLLSSLAFDSSMVGLFWTLCDGGTIVFPEDERRLDVAHLGDVIRRTNVSHLLALPSLYRLLVEESDVNALASLSTVIVAGESCPASLVELHQRRMPGVELHNEYGPTEGTVWSHACRLDQLDVSSSVPIGSPIPNASCVVLDEFGMQTPVGIPGELFIGGPGITPGYLRRDDMTSAVFGEVGVLAGSSASGRFYRTGDLCKWRSDGLLDFIGRADGQVKVRGYRIELEEIETVLAAQPSVRAAAILVVEAADGDPMRRRLVGWYSTSASNTKSLDDELTAALALQLPKYMVPSAMVRVDEMPLTATGKIDRSALPIPDVGSDGQQRSGEPVDELEATLLEIWRRVLGREDIGVHDDFFDLGGNSLDAMRLFARIQRRTGRDLLLSSLFESPTVSGVAAGIRQPASALTNSAIVPIKASGFKRPFFYVGPHQVSVLELDKIAKYFDPDRPFFGLQTSGLRIGEPVLETIEEIASYFIDAIKEQQPHGPYLIGGHCDGSWTALEMARQFADRGDQVDYLGLADLPPPHSDAGSLKRFEQIIDRVKYYRKDGRLWNALSWQIELRLKSNVLLRFGGAAARRERAVRVAHGAAFDRYDPSVDLRTQIHLVRSSEMAVLMDEVSWYRDFSEVTTNTDITSTHARLLMEPETEELAAALGAGLDTVEP